MLGCHRVSVCLSATSRSCTKTATRRITQTTLHDSPGTLWFYDAKYMYVILMESPQRGREMQVG